mmetsp:Transcript_24635/g.57843  ORF Transcript_24635/g.57843 Transcript_24635/m.57843 type:complete len:212 (+) Transcript_24635:202-837(+)
MIHDTLPTVTMKQTSKLNGFCKDAMIGPAPLISAMGVKAGLTTSSLKTKESLKRKGSFVDSNVSKPPPKKRRKYKSVRFSDMASVIVRPISDDELKEQWLQPHEYKVIDTRRRESLHEWKRLLLQGQPLDKTGPFCVDEEEHCFRGLEQLLDPQQMMARKLNHIQYRQVLLQEQHFQRYHGFSDPYVLRQLSELFGLQSTHRAQLRAVVDE